MMRPEHVLIENNLLCVLSELLAQPEVEKHFPKNELSYLEQLSFVKDHIVMAGEYGLAYEEIIALLETYPYRLSGSAAVKLLEAGLIFGYKTDRPEDSKFNWHVSHEF